MKSLLHNQNLQWTLIRKLLWCWITSALIHTQRYVTLHPIWYYMLTPMQHSLLHLKHAVKWQFFYCGDLYNKNTTPQSRINGPVHIECKTLKHVVASAAEAETGGLFHVCQKAVQIRRMMYALSHPQPATPTKTDNSTSISFIKEFRKVLCILGETLTSYRLTQVKDWE